MPRFIILGVSVILVVVAWVSWPVAFYSRSNKKSWVYPGPGERCELRKLRWPSLAFLPPLLMVSTGNAERQSLRLKWIDSEELQYTVRCATAQGEALSDQSLVRFEFVDFPGCSFDVYSDVLAAQMHQGIRQVYQVTIDHQFFLVKFPNGLGVEDWLFAAPRKFPAVGTNRARTPVRARDPESRVRAPDPK